MSYETSKEMLLVAQKGRYAVAAFNAENMEMVIAIIEKAEEMRAPVMIQTTPSTLKYASPAIYYAMVKTLAEKAEVPVCMHLDHGNSVALVGECLRSGYSSVMIDGSKLVLEENIALTKEAASAAAKYGVSVEGELGSVGGKEDDTVGGNGYTIPSEAVRFVKETGVDSLAVGIGTAHGIYKTTPVLDVERLKQIRAVVNIPLVLHGASGLSDQAVAECIANGICKVNIATELRQAYTEGVREFLVGDRDAFDPKKYGKAAIERVKAVVEKKILMCGCQGKA